MIAAWIDLLGAVAIVTSPLLLAAIGEWVVERSGVVNVAVEGAMTAACFLAFAVSVGTGSVGLGVLGGIVGGMTVTSLLALLVVRLRVDAIVAGTALNLAAMGGVALAFRAHVERGEATQVLPIPSFVLPVVALVMLCGVAVVSARTRWGLVLRASGENARAALALGVSVGGVRVLALLFGGACAGLAGAELLFVESRTFVEGMTGGRGFLALAIVVCGRWSGGGVLAAATLFGAATVLQYRFQAGGAPLPYPIFLGLPYVLTLLVLAVIGRRSRAPADLNRPFEA